MYICTKQPNMPWKDNAKQNKTKCTYDQAQSRFRLPLLLALKSLTFIWGGHPLPSHRHIETSSSPSKFLRFQKCPKCPWIAMKKSGKASKGLQQFPWTSQLNHPEVSNNFHEEINWNIQKPSKLSMAQEASWIIQKHPELSMKKSNK
jgi:hypothetical protein